MDKRVAHCHLVASVLAADGMMQPEEKAFLERAMTEMGLSPDERDQVMHFEGADQAEDVMRQVSGEERQRLLDALVEAALIDGRLSPHETELVKQISQKIDA